MVDFTHLPPELLLHVFFEVQRKDRVLPAPYARLCVISRVCRAWRVPAQTALYHTIAPRLRARHGGTRTSAEQLLNALERLTAGQSSLPRAVLALEVPLGVEARDCGVNTLTRHANTDTLVRLVTLLPNLRTLRLRLHEPTESATLLYEIATAGASSVRSLDPRQLHALESHSSVRTLAVDALLYVADPPLVGQLARVWPHLAHVCVSQRGSAIPSSGAPRLYMPLLSSTQLRSFTFLGQTLPVQFNSVSVSMGVGESDGGDLDLHALSLDEPIDLIQLVPLSRCLRSLHLGALSPRTTESRAWCLRSFERLERVALGDIPPAALTCIVEALPSSVRHIALIRTASPHMSSSLISERVVALFQGRPPPAPGALRFSLVEHDDMEQKLWHCKVLWRPLLLLCEEKCIDVEIRCEKDMWWRNPEFEFMTSR
ncbi:hypothetical protein EXIGLDRAFT_715843 [Exidia glandulosa HHB12029]|uniref:F-box domain-containing protein n=1 Tax=Exidia glandulosa HHB12029 TaxID=1314781 RepID=A0A165QLN2_EXIGL|nr:hypothetical protein EXIGLDRAFT_715843 [Exidia glandulosa HHB12029]